MYSTTTYTGDGSTVTFSIPFDYIDPSHVKVAVDGVDQSFTFPSSSQATLATAPANGTAVKVYRVTPSTSPLVSFVDGHNNLTASDLNKDTKQCLFVAQEFSDALELLTDTVEGSALAEGFLPVSTSLNAFLMGNGSGGWAVQSAATAAAALGISGTNAVPTPVAGNRFVVTKSGTAEYELQLPAAVRTSLGLGTMATANLASYGILSYSVGTASGEIPRNSDLGTASTKAVGTTIGNVVEVVDVGSGTAGLPALDARNLTNIPAASIKVARYTNVGSTSGMGALSSGNNVLVLNTEQYDSIGASLAANTITLPAGSYVVDLEAPTISYSGNGTLRLYDTGAAALVASSADSCHSGTRSRFYITLASSATLQMVMRYTTGSPTIGTPIADPDSTNKNWWSATFWKVG